MNMHGTYRNRFAAVYFNTVFTLFYIQSFKRTGKCEHACTAMIGYKG